MNAGVSGDKPSGPLPRKGTLLRTARAVAWGFLGLRKGSEYKEDLASINPLHLIAVGLVAILLLVLALIGVVNWVV